MGILSCVYRTRRLQMSSSSRFLYTAGMTTALIPGSFDPITIGHVNIIERAHHIFGHVIVAIGVNVNKNYRFSVEQRLEYVKKSVAHIGGVDVCIMEGTLVDFAAAHGADVVVKGIRQGGDVEWEGPQAQVNRDLGGIETLWMPTEGAVAHISSSMVRELLTWEKPVDRYVPEAIVSLIVDNSK